MYIGRFVIVGRTTEGVPYLGYRVSSRSFPDRWIRVGKSADDLRATVLPKAEAPPSENPYIAYNCLRTAATGVIVANGTHVDPIAEKVGLGFPLRDAMALSLLAMDYEKDSYNTPRITAGLDIASDALWLGFVGSDQLLVRTIAVEPGSAQLIATYECVTPTPIALPGTSAAELCASLMESAYEHPVAAITILCRKDAMELATLPD